MRTSDLLPFEYQPRPRSGGAFFATLSAGNLFLTASSNLMKRVKTKIPDLISYSNLLPSLLNTSPALAQAGLFFATLSA